MCVCVCNFYGVPVWKLQSALSPLLSGGNGKNSNSLLLQTQSNRISGCLPAEYPGAMTRLRGAVSTETGDAEGLAYSNSSGWKRPRLHFSTTFSHCGPICHRNDPADIYVNQTLRGAELFNNVKALFPTKRLHKARRSGPVTEMTRLTLRAR